MIYTSSDAHRFWCPHIRVQDSTNNDHKIAVNMYDTEAARTGQTGGGDNYGCIGQRCSQWRWFAKNTPNSDEPVGYCGLAGRPDTELYMDIFF